MLALTPSEHLSENEIAAAALADQGGVFNPQQQLRVNWPAEPVVAWAYVDQLERGGGLSKELLNELGGALQQSTSRLESGERDEELAARLDSLADSLASGGNAGTRAAALAETLGGISARLR